MNYALVLAGYKARNQLTQVELSKRLGVSQSMISKLQTGKLEMPAGMLCQIYSDYTLQSIERDLGTLMDLGRTYLEEKKERKREIAKLQKKRARKASRNKKT